MTMNNDNDRYLGISFVTGKSKVYGVVVEVAAHTNPLFRKVRLTTPEGESRWTSACIYDLHDAIKNPVAQP